MKEVMEIFKVKDEERILPMFSRELHLIFNKKVPLKVEAQYLSQGFKASKENINSIKEKPIIISELFTWQNYYMFRWVIENGYVLYKYKNEEFWIRPDRYEEIIGNTQNMNIEETAQQDIKNIAYSLGNSMETLYKIMKDKKEYNLNQIKIKTFGIIENNFKLKIENQQDAWIDIQFPEKIKGEKYDFLYIELKSKYRKKENRKIKIYWEGVELPIKENKSLILEDRNGKLLIPLGVHLSWIKNEPNKIRLKFLNTANGMEIEIKKIEFMELDRRRK